MVDKSIDTIDTLVLDWIVRSAYLSTFSKLPTSETSLDVAEKGSLLFRAEVAKLIRLGRIAEAIERIEARNFNSENDQGSICKITSTRSLEQSQPLNLRQILFILRLQHFIELIRQRNTPVALSFVQTNLMPFAGEFEQVLQEGLGVLAYTEPEKSPLDWLFERPKRYSALASLTNSSLSQIETKAATYSPLETFIKQVKVLDGLVSEMEGFGNEIDDRKWSEIRRLLDSPAKRNFAKVVKTD